MELWRTTTLCWLEKNAAAANFVATTCNEVFLRKNGSRTRTREPFFFVCELSRLQFTKILTLPLSSVIASTQSTYLR